MNSNPWNERARWLIGRAVLAPSSHNTQPWIFRITASTIELHADRTRALPVNDPDDRELAISCACALMNLRVAAAGAGLGVQIQLLPDPEDADLLARLCFGEQSAVLAEDVELADFVETRRTYRKRFAPREVDAAALEQMQREAEREGVRLLPLASEDARQRAAGLVAEGDAVQWANPSWRRELAAWMHPRRRGDGLALPALAVPLAQGVVRSFDLGGGVGARDRQLAEASPLLAVLTTEGDQPRDWLRAGQGLQRVLLRSCRLGLQASYLNQPIQVASLRPQLQELVGGGIPQILMRVGYPLEEISAAPRRALDEVIE